MKIWDGMNQAKNGIGKIVDGKTYLSIFRISMMIITINKVFNNDYCLYINDF